MHEEIKRESEHYFWQAVPYGNTTDKEGTTMIVGFHIG